MSKVTFTFTMRPATWQQSFLPLKRELQLSLDVAEGQRKTCTNILWHVNFSSRVNRSSLQRETQRVSSLNYASPCMISSPRCSPGNWKTISLLFMWAKLMNCLVWQCGRLKRSRGSLGPRVKLLGTCHEKATKLRLLNHQKLLINKFNYVYIKVQYVFFKKIDWYSLYTDLIYLMKNTVKTEIL